MQGDEVLSQGILQFVNFSFKYNAQAEPTLKNINLNINKGEKILIAGPSGSGKSTLSNCVNGLIPFSYKGESKGQILLDGKPTNKLSIFEISKYVGTVLQDTDSQFIGLTVAEDIAFSLENQCVEEPELHNRVKEVAELVNIGTHLKSAPSELSGGQKQRVTLGGVLVDNVDILLFDEPLANLDPETGKKAIELIDRIHKKLGLTIIIIEHRLEDVLWRSVDRIVLMNEGEIIRDEEPDKLLAKNILSERGIREPLYITALKYAGVDLNEVRDVASVENIQLSEDAKAKVRTWFNLDVKKDKPVYEETLLEAVDLDFTYESSRREDVGHHALDKINLKVKKGELLAIVGKNGAGKSTFSKVVCGFENHQRGQIFFKGEDISSLSIKERAESIGYIMQNPNQMISQTMIFDEVALGLRNLKLSEEEIKERVNETLKICGLWTFRSWPISALSFGQKKRVTIASILVMEPELIILDEPTAGQDYKHYTDIMNFLKGLIKKGITIVIITHDMHLMLEYADRAVVFADSKVIADDKPSKILTDEDIIKKASLKETSLYDLSLKCEIQEGSAFVDHFIDYERRILEND